MTKKNTPPGFATLAVLQLLGLSLNAMFLGIIGEYLGRVYQQVKRKPLTVIERQWHFPGAAPDGERMLSTPESSPEQ